MAKPLAKPMPEIAPVSTGAAQQEENMALRLIQGQKGVVFRTRFVISTGQKDLKFRPEILGVPDAVVATLHEIDAKHSTKLDMYPLVAQLRNQLTSMKRKIVTDCKMQAADKDWLFQGRFKSAAEEAFLEMEDHVYSVMIPQLKAGLDDALAACEAKVKALLSSAGLGASEVDQLWELEYAPQFYDEAYIDQNFYVAMAKPQPYKPGESGDGTEREQRIEASELRALSSEAKVSLEAEIRGLRRDLTEALGKSGKAVARSGGLQTRLEKAADLRERVAWTSNLLRFQADDLEETLQTIEADIKARLEGTPIDIQVKPQEPALTIAAPAQVLVPELTPEPQPAMAVAVGEEEFDPGF